MNPADADTEGQHGAAPEPAGPAEDDAYAQGPQTRRRRTTSVSQAISAAAAGVDDFSTAPDADTDAAAAVQSDAPKARCGSKVQGEAPKFRRGRSRSSSSVSQLKQVRRSYGATGSCSLWWHAVKHLNTLFDLKHCATECGGHELHTCSLLNGLLFTFGTQQWHVGDKAVIFWFGLLSIVYSTVARAQSFTPAECLLISWVM